jgi:hypothetical protein
VGKPFLQDIPDLLGGLNESASGNIADNEFAVLQNFHVDTLGLIQREGTTELAGPHPASEEILGVFRYAPSFNPTETTLLGCEASIAKVNGTAIEALSIADGHVYQTSAERWWGEQYNDEFFMCQKGQGGVKRLYGDSVMEGGIPAPTTAPNAVAGGSGSGKKIAGQYFLAFRYFNSITGAKSKWSPLSKGVTIADLEKINVSAITSSDSRQVNSRQIGATYPLDATATSGVIYVVGQINDNSSTTFEENALSPDEYGEADVDVGGNITTDIRHGPPPDQAWALEIHKERLFVLNKDGISWSEAALPQSFKATSFLPFAKGTGLLSWDQHGLVLFSEERVKILLGDTPSDWRIDTLSEQHRCPAGKSAAVGDGTLFWYTGTNIVASGGGAPTILPRIERIRVTLDSIPDADKDDVIGETIPAKGWYVLSVPTSDGRKVIVYDYVKSAFAVFPAGPKTLARLFADNGEEAIYAAFANDDTLYEYLSGTTDNGTPVTAKLRTKAYGAQGAHHITRRVLIDCPATNGTVTVRVYHDDVLVATRAGVSLNKAEVKRITVAATGRPGATVQVELEYAGTARLHIDALQVEGVDLRRRVKAI